MTSWSIRRIAPLAAAVGLAACSTAQRRSAETAVADVLIPREQEQQLGLQVKQELEQKQGIKYLEDPQIVAYVQTITSKILPFAKKDRPDVTWTVQVIDDPKTVNAFATPGGYLYVYSGLLLAADDTAEVAGVLGHEAGHVVARHSARQMVDAFGLQSLAAIALGKDANGLSKLAAGVAGQGALLAYSRADESEADEFGARYASAAGYDPHGIATFFEKLEKGQGKQPGWAKLLSTHPASADRIKRVNEYIAKHGLKGAEGKSGTEIAAVKTRIQALPSAKAEQAGKPAPGAPSTGAGQ